MVSRFTPQRPAADAGLVAGLLPSGPFFPVSGFVLTVAGVFFMARTRIKVCGVTEEEHAIAAAQAGADAVGFVLSGSGPRAIGPEEAFAIMSVLPPMMTTVGVFHDTPLDDFSDAEEECPTPYTQLCGNESVHLVRSCGPDVIKCVNFNEATIAAELAQWDGVDEVSAILLRVSDEGGPFDWARIRPHLEPISKAIILGGNLTPANVGEAILAVAAVGGGCFVGG